MIMQPLAKFLSSSHPEMPTIAWHLIVNRTAQRGRTSCSVASLCIALNGLISTRHSDVLDKQLSEARILDMLPDSDLRRNLLEGSGGATLDQIAMMATETLKGLGVSGVSATAHHMEEADGIYLENFKKDLASSGHHGSSVIIANYHQGVATGRELTHGHHAPVVSLGRDSSELCVIDPAQEGSPYLLDIEQMAKAMATTDTTAGRSRGYLRIAFKVQ